MCMPSFIVDLIEGNDEWDWAENWAENAWIIDESTIPHTIIITGLKPHYPPTQSPIPTANCHSNQDLTEDEKHWCCENVAVHCPPSVAISTVELSLSFETPLDDNQKAILEN